MLLEQHLEEAEEAARRKDMSYAEISIFRL
jgi:hypothetical protein